MILAKSKTSAPEVFCFFNLNMIEKVIVTKNGCEIFFTNDGGITELKDKEALSFIADLEKIYKKQFCE